MFLFFSWIIPYLLNYSLIYLCIIRLFFISNIITVGRMIDENKLAQIISGLLSPVSIALLVSIIFSIKSLNNESYNLFVGLSLSIFFLVLFPLIFILYFYKKGVIDLWVSDRKKRTPLYIISIIGYIISSMIFFILDYNILFTISFAYLCVTTVVMIINLYTKISSHSAGVAGPLAAIFYVFGIVSIPLFVLVPIVYWARRKLNAHTPFQLIMGVIIAIIVTFFVYYSSNILQ